MADRRTACHLLRVDANRMDKYVNMTDIISAPLSGEDVEIELIELLFFAYRDFVSDPDEVLTGLGFGRAHHRVLHFIGRDPGMTVAQLLDILRITKQSLGRVLKQLIDKGYVYQKEGETDRRQRLLHLTDRGEALRQKLMDPQRRRIRRALSECDPEAHGTYRRVLSGLINPENREAVAAWLRRTSDRPMASGD